MKLEEMKRILPALEAVNFKLPNGQYVPQHFHVTEVGLVSKHFIDCGGVERHEQKVNFQLWDANDYEHKLKPQKLQHIIALSQNKLGINDELEIEVEYQGNAIEKFELAFNGGDFELLAKQTACLAMEACGLPSAKEKVLMGELQASNESCCTPGGTCC